jgi:hypothetical protein
MATQNIQLGNQSEMDDLSNSINALSNRVESVKNDTNNSNQDISASDTPIAFSNSAAGHNGIYRGKDLTGIYTIDQICQMVSDGTFEDLYIGDYITVTISTSYASNEEVDIVFADFNTYLHNGSTEVTKNHITCVTKECFKTTAAMNSSTTTSGGYVGSAMHKTVLPTYATALQSVLNNHIITHNSWLTSSVSTSGNSMAGRGLTGYASGNTWTDVQLCLMNEVQLYGSVVYSSSWYDIGERNRQLALFQLAPELKVAHLGKGSTSRQWYWLSAVANSASFANCSGIGGSDCSGAGNSGGVRPLFLIG